MFRHDTQMKARTAAICVHILPSDMFNTMTKSLFSFKPPPFKWTSAAADLCFELLYHPQHHSQLFSFNANTQRLNSSSCINLFGVRAALRSKRQKQKRITKSHKIIKVWTTRQICITLSANYSWKHGSLAANSSAAKQPETCLESQDFRFTVLTA